MAAHLRDLGRSRRDLAVPDPQIAVRWAEDTCSTAVGSEGHAGTVGGMQGGLGVSIRGVAGFGRHNRRDSTFANFCGCRLQNYACRLAGNLVTWRTSGVEATGEV